jgi:hypothetical protein
MITIALAENASLGNPLKQVTRPTVIFCENNGMNHLRVNSA